MRVEPDDQTLPGRVAIAMKGQSVNSFAEKCGISEGAIRQYLAGSTPGVDKIVAMARVAGVSVEWLATGKGAMHAREVRQEIDEGMLFAVVQSVLGLFVEDQLSDSDLEMATRRIVDLYADLAAADLNDAAEYHAALRYAVVRLRKERGGPAPSA